MGPEVLNLLLLPLLGGYVFCTKCAWTSFAARIADGQRLIYSSSVAGIFLLCLARLIETGLLRLQSAPELKEQLELQILFVGELCAIASGLLLVAVSAILKRETIPRRILCAVSGAMLIAAPGAFITILAPYDVKGWAVLAGIFVVFALVVAFGALSDAVDRSGALTDEEMPSSCRVVLLFPTLFACLLALLLFGPPLIHAWPNFSNIPYSGLALFAAGLGATLWMPSNVLLTNRWAWRRAHEANRTSGLERLLYRAFRLKMPVQLTMKGGKVYTGFVLELPVPITRVEGGCIEFLPVSSGYRSAETQDVVITTDYAQVIADLTKPAQADDGSEKEHGPTVVPETETFSKEAGRGPRLQKDWNRLVTLKKAVPISEVQIASMYDEKYKKLDFAIP